MNPCTKDMGKHKYSKINNKSPDDVTMMSLQWYYLCIGVVACGHFCKDPGLRSHQNERLEYVYKYNGKNGIFKNQ